MIESISGLRQLEHPWEIAVPQQSLGLHVVEAVERQSDAAFQAGTTGMPAATSQPPETMLGDQDQIRTELKAIRKLLKSADYHDLNEAVITRHF